MIETRQAEALLAIIEEGSFDRAARRLHVTAPAISQRIRLLEEQFGQVLIERAVPCRATEAGKVLLSFAQQVLHLERDARSRLEQAGEDRTKVSLVVNADSLATWFFEILRPLAEERVEIEVLIEDQDHSAELLRSGRALGAVTSIARPVQGCRIEELGTMCYEAVASPEFLREFFPKGITVEALSSAPMLVFSRKDNLQERFLKKFTRKALHPPIHWLPSAEAFIQATRAGIGWGMNPIQLTRQDLQRGTLVRLSPRRAIDVPLYWQCWRLETELLSKLTTLVIREAKKSLLQKARVT